jgi:hypothetical protein
MAITPDQAVKGNLDGKLVQIDAELIGRDDAAADPTVMLRAGGVLIPAILPTECSSWRRASMEGRESRAHHWRQ